MNKKLNAYFTLTILGFVLLPVNAHAADGTRCDLPDGTVIIEHSFGEPLVALPRKVATTFSSAFSSVGSQITSAMQKACKRDEALDGGPKKLPPQLQTIVMDTNHQVIVTGTKKKAEYTVSVASGKFICTSSKSALPFSGCGQVTE